MAAYKMLSSDSHIMEPPDLWEDRIAPQFRDRAPRVVQEDDGDWWMVDGYRTNSFQGGAQPGTRFDNPKALRPAAKFADVGQGPISRTSTSKTTRPTVSTVRCCIRPRGCCCSRYRTTCCWRLSFGPPWLFPTDRPEALARSNPCGSTLTQPAQPVQAALCRATPRCAPRARGGGWRGTLGCPQGVFGGQQFPEAI
jgi:hypothetical protein